MGLLNHKDSLSRVQIYGERMGSLQPKKKKVRFRAILLAALMVVVFFVGGFFMYRMSGQLAEQEAKIAELEAALRETETEKVLLDQSLKEKNQLIEDIRNGIVSSGGVKEYRVYLTFDDGPCENTDEVMDILEDYDIKGTFFVTGSESDTAAKVYRRIMEDGHVLANHTFSHDYNSIYRSWEDFYQDVQRLETLVCNATGQNMAKIVRFPGGSNTGNSEIMREIKKNLTQLGYTYFDWNVSGEDAIKTNITAEEILNNVIKYTDGKSTAIVLLHTTAKTDATVEALPQIIEYLIEEGYSFHTLDEADAPTGIVFD